jgi:ATP-binding cassette subfamily B protein
VAIARALLREPAVLVLDDALSAVDTETERMIIDAVGHRRGRHTTILIAHRLSTVRHADKVIVLDRGRLVQEGDHESLVAVEGLYRRLWKIQSAIETEEAMVEAEEVGGDEAEGSHATGEGQNDPREGTRKRRPADGHVSVRT